MPKQTAQVEFKGGNWMSTLRSKTIEEMNYCLSYAVERKSEFKLDFDIVKLARRYLRGIINLPNKTIIRDTILFLWENEEDKSTLEIEINKDKVSVNFDSKSTKKITQTEYPIDHRTQDIVRFFVDKLVEEHAFSCPVPQAF